MTQQLVISIRRIFNIGNFETIALEMSRAIADPDKTLRSQEEETRLAHLYLMRDICTLAVNDILRIHTYRNTNPHPNVELREFALSATTYAYNQCISEIKTLDAEIASLQNGQHHYGPDGLMVLNT